MKGLPFFGRRNDHGPGRSTGYSADHYPSYRYRVEGRAHLLGRFDTITAGLDRPSDSERERLARVLEELAQEGWKLVGVADGDFILRRRP